MTFLTGALWGLLGSALYQLVVVYQFRLEKKRWPWQDKRSGWTLPFFLFSICFKLVAAFAVVGLLAVTEQVSGPWVAVGAGMVADVIIIQLANSGRKEYAK
jgi:hypothetical protein